MNSSEDKLRRSIQALAQPAEQQIALFPEFVAVGDELALDFDGALERFKAASLSVPARAISTIEALESYIEELSDPQNEEFWLDTKRLRLDPRWDRLRQLAAAVLESFGWPNVVPAKNEATYIGQAKVVENR